MRYSLPFHLEHKLVNKFGYVIEIKRFNDCIVFVKPKKAKPKAKAAQVIYTPGLTSYQQKQLTQRCDNLVDHFPDPYSVPTAVRQRLHNLAQSLASLAERQHVINFMEEHFPETLKESV